MVWYAFGNVYIACEFGHQVQHRFERIHDVVGELDWYLFPDELRKILPFVEQFVQQPVEFEFFGSISCGRPLFKDVSEMFLVFFPEII